MHLFLLYPKGRTVEAILLSAGIGQMRVAVRESRDTLELRMTDGRWMSEGVEPVELGSLIHDGHSDVQSFCSAVAPRTLAAG